MIGFMIFSETSIGNTNEDSRTKRNKELDYQIRCTGIFSKPPCGAFVHAKVLSDKVKALPTFVC